MPAHTKITAMQTITMHPYDPEVFNALPDFFVAREELSAAEEQINELGDIICSYGLHQVIGLCLLHKHFDISADERLVRRYKDDSFARMTAERGIEDELYPYLWCLSEGGLGFGFYPVEFCIYANQIDQKRAKAHFMHLNRNKDFFAVIGREMITKNLERRFGLSGLHARSCFRLKAEETLLELTDEQRRILTLERQTEDYVKKLGDTTKTLWYFYPTTEQVDGARCASHCYGHCNGHSSQ